MIDVAIQEFGTVVRTRADAGSLMTDLKGYKECLAQIAYLLLGRWPNVNDLGRT